MRERIIATTAGIGMLAAGCGLEPQNPTPPVGELVVAHRTTFTEMEQAGEIRPPSQPLEVGARALGMCIEFTRKESATINSGIIRVQYGDQIGRIPTYAKPESGEELVDTFKDKTEHDLVNEYPRCEEYDKKQTEGSNDARRL